VYEVCIFRSGLRSRVALSLYTTLLIECSKIQKWEMEGLQTRDLPFLYPLLLEY